MHLYLCLNDEKNYNMTLVLHKHINNLFRQAVQLAPDNQVALLNYLLYQWQQALIRDDEFLFGLFFDMSNIDIVAAKLMTLLFKKNVEGKFI